MNVYLAEFLGTAILVLLGNGVVANVLLKRTKGHASGWLVITAGWALAVFVAVSCVGDFSGAHINPAVTLGLAIAGELSWWMVPGYMLSQFSGGFLGALLVYIFYQQHYPETSDADKKLGTFCTGPAIQSIPANLFCEVVATFVLVLMVLLAADPSFEASSGGTLEGKLGLGAVGALPVALVVFAIGICLGGTTGYAINPARDLSPRAAHSILSIPGKRDSDWGYAWIPVVGPLLGGALAALVYLTVLATVESA